MLKNLKTLAGNFLRREPEQPHLTPFGERIQERNRVFWQTDHPDMHDAGTCRNELLTRDHPLSAWHCCPLWQRKLSNKWNAREFASKLGCRVPDLYWHGRNVAALDVAALPSHYVIRPTIGHSTGGVFVMADGRNLLDGRTYSPDKLKRHLAQTVAGDPRVSLLVEEFMKSEDGRYRLPTDYKLLMFGDKVGAVGVIRRRSRKEVKMRFYPENWEPFSEPITLATVRKGLDDLTEPPACLAEIIEDAKRLSRAYGTFIRLDFYATAKGSVFGEFSPTPDRGKNISAFGSRYLLELWDEAYPEPSFERKVSG